MINIPKIGSFSAYNYETMVLEMRWEMVYVSLKRRSGSNWLRSRGYFGCRVSDWLLICNGLFIDCNCYVTVTTNVWTSAWWWTKVNELVMNIWTPYGIERSDTYFDKCSSLYCMINATELRSNRQYTMFTHLTRGRWKDRCNIIHMVKIYIDRGIDINQFKYSLDHLCPFIITQA